MGVGWLSNMTLVFRDLGRGSLAFEILWASVLRARGFRVRIM